MLLGREEAGVVDAVERLGAMQAQEPRPPFIGLWSRVEGFDPADLRAALHKRSLVRAMTMRATLHLMSAADYRAVRAALEPVMATAMKVLKGRAEGLDLKTVLPAARSFLEDGPRTFAEIRDHLAALFPEVDERALGYAVRTRMHLVMVPTDDRWAFPATSAFTLAEEWLGAPVEPGASPQELVRRHLAAFGPASAADVQAWCGLTGMAAVLEEMRPGLRAFRTEAGRELLDLPDATRPDEDVPAPARLLPEFDSLVLAHADRTRVIADEHRAGLVTRNLRVRATFLWDGFAAGTWTAQRTRGTATLTLTPFARLPRGATKALEGEAEALIRFTEPEAKDHQIVWDRPGS
jgi:hypothetical protein